MPPLTTPVSLRLFACPGFQGFSAPLRMIVSEDCDPDVIVAKNKEMRAKGVRGLWYWVYQNKTTSRKAAYLQEAGITIRLVILDDRRIPWLATPSEEDPDDVYLGIPLLG